MIDINKHKIRDELTKDEIFEILEEFGGEPEYSSFGIISRTICHNPAGEGSRKLYFYSNSGLFHCYTGCPEPSFDIFQLIIKIMKIQYNIDFDLNDAVRYIARRFGISGTEISKNEIQDWDIFKEYDRINELTAKDYHVELKEYDKTILNNLNYKVKIGPWLKDGISQNVLTKAKIGFYPGGDQITIPHYDINGRFIGLRGRTVCQEDAEKYGKYRPIIIGKQMYNHPLGMNLYNINNAKEAISKLRKAIVFESEKSSLLYQTYFGMENDISVACCGSNLSAYQVQLLKDCGCEELILAFDRQFQKIGDDEFLHLKNNLIKLGNKYKTDMVVSAIFDKRKITAYKASPVDEGAEKFIKLYNERIFL